MVEAKNLFGQRLGDMTIDSLAKELKVTPLKVAYLKGWKALHGESTSKSMIVRNHGSLFVRNHL